MLPLFQTEILYHALTVSPALFYLDPALEIYFYLEEIFKVSSCFLTYLSKHRAAFSDKYALV